MHKTLALTLGLAASAASLVNAAATHPTGNPDKERGHCISGTFPFKPERIFDATPHVGVPDNFDYSKYDYVINNGGPKALALTGTSATMTLNPPTNATAPADIVKGSLAQWIRYGKVTTRMTAPAVPGIVTTFITMSETGDEIDWEAVGGDAQTIQTNIFYKGIVEFNVHGGKHAVANIETAHTYVIDWKSTGITFSIDDKVVRETTPAKETAASAMTPPGEQWFPKTPSMVQFSLWQADSEWAGGKVNWATAPKVQSTIDSITVECYDDNDEPVAFWPPAAKLRATTPVENAAQPSGSKTNGGSSGGSTGGSTGSGDKKGGSLPDGSVSGASSTALSAFFSVGSALAALAFLS